MSALPLPIGPGDHHGLDGSPPLEPTGQEQNETAVSFSPPGGPTDEERSKGKTYLWGEASDLNGNRVESRLQTPEGYTITALAALNITQKILAGNFQFGFQTPAKAYGADLVMEIEGVQRQDVV